MSEPYVTVLREIHDNPDQFALLVIASWCGKSADEIERLTAELDRVEREYDDKCDALQARIEALEGERKRDCVAFFQWWWNQPGSNTAQGYDEWLAATEPGESDESR